MVAVMQDAANSIPVSLFSHFFFVHSLISPFTWSQPKTQVLAIKQASNQSTTHQSIDPSVNQSINQSVPSAIHGR